jgi:hypothetical protein
MPTTNPIFERAKREGIPFIAARWKLGREIHIDFVEDCADLGIPPTDESLAILKATVARMSGGYKWIIHDTRDPEDRR